MWRVMGWTAMALLLVTLSPLRAEVVVATVDWSLTGGATGTVLDDEGRTFLRVEGAEGPRVLEVLVLDGSSLRGPRYALRGELRHRDVEGAAYLEMWTVLPDGGRYFTRTLAEMGPTGSLRGSSAGWRAVELPFDLGASGQTPERLVLNVVLPGAGVVDIAGLELVDEIP